MEKRNFMIAIGLILLLVIAGCSSKNGQVKIEKKLVEPTSIQTFTDTKDEICRDESGKPIVRLFATSWCPHCKWIKDTYTTIVREYADDGKIFAYLWEVDKNDNLLTDAKDAVPDSENAIFEKYNPKGSIPTFVFGCKYARVGNGYEQTGDSSNAASSTSRAHLAAEEGEFRAVIEDLINEKGDTSKPTDDKQTTTTQTETVKEFDIAASQFKFTPDTITVNKGDKVKITLTSTDVTHGFAIAEFNVDAEVSKGEEKTVEFVADKAGTFTFYCSVPCGSGHSGMNGKLIVNE